MTIYSSKADVEVTQVEEDLFLVHPEKGAVYHLDPIGAGLWRLLAEPMEMEEIVTVLTAAFPDTPQKDVREDIAKIIAEMHELELITCD